MHTSAPSPARPLNRFTAARPTVVVVVMSMLTALVALVAGPVSTARAAMPIPKPSTIPSAVALPTVQTNGIVWAVAVVGDTVYAGGRFSKARPAGVAVGGAGEVDRHNLLAFSLSTGELLPFAPDVEGQIFSNPVTPGPYCKSLGNMQYDCDSIYRIKATPDGSKIFVAGDFSTVDGAQRQRIAAFDTATNTLNTTYHPALDGRVKGLAVTADTVYLGGDFSSIAGVARTRLAATDLSGTVLPWAPTADLTVWSLSAAPALGRVILGGNFDMINTTAVHGLEAVDATTGANVPWAYRTMTSSTVVTDIVNDGTAAYVSGYNYTGSAGAARFEGRMALDLATGQQRWVDGCYGDTQAVNVMNGVVFGVSHSHDCSLMNSMPQLNPVNYMRLVAETTTVGGRYQGSGTSLVPTGAPIPSQVQFLPDFDGGPSGSYWRNGPWSLDSNAKYLVVGGEFTTVNQGAQQSLVRFAVPPTGPSTSKPVGFLAPVPTVQGDGSVRVAFNSTYDRDSTDLTYQLLRSDKSTPIATKSIPRTAFWNESAQSLVDRTLPAGQSVTYRVRAVDGDGNTTSTVNSASVTGTATAPTLARYAKVITDDDPYEYWRLGESTGSALKDVVGADDLNATQVTLGAPGAIGNDTDTGATFGSNTTTPSLASIATSRYALDQFSEELWFKTTTTRGGQLMGWSSSATGTSTTSDRKLYLDNTGRVFFGVNPGTRTTINSPATYRDGNWHHVVAGEGPVGLQLFVDGALVASDPTTTVAQFVRSGYWRLGNDSLSGWPSAPATGNFAGSLDEVAVYQRALSASTVAAHYAARTTQPPVAAFTQTCTGRSCAFDATTSTSGNGAITQYSWDFGDGTSVTGATPTHKFGTDGAQTVKLTVTDASNLTGTVTRTVTVANTPPTADFTASCAARVCDVTSTSTDPDGTIASVAWAFGDTGTATGPTAQHTYAADGTYPIALTVTDDAGATATKTTSVTVTGVPAGTIATDGFARTVASGWGSADFGGPWTVSTASSFAVGADGGTITGATAGATRTATLNTVAAGDVDLTTELAVDKIPTAGSTYFYAIGRQTAANTDYRARVRVQAGGVVGISLVRRAGTTTDVAIGTEQTVAGLTLTAGTKLKLRFQIAGSGTATLRTKVWRSSDAEPDWQRTGTDTTAGQQVPGAVGLALVLSSSDAPVPLMATVRSFSAVAP